MTDVSVVTSEPAQAPTPEQIEAANEADIERIEAQTEATVAIIEAQTEAEVTLTEARAEAEATVIEARAEAEAQVEEARAENNDTWRTEILTMLQNMSARMETMEQELSTLKLSSATAENNSTPKSMPSETENPSSLVPEHSEESEEPARVEEAPAAQRKPREIFL